MIIIYVLFQKNAHKNNKKSDFMRLAKACCIAYLRKVSIHITRFLKPTERISPSNLLLICKLEQYIATNTILTK